jgi:ethanolamine utilization protein EutA
MPEPVAPGPGPAGIGPPPVPGPAGTGAPEPWQADDIELRSVGIDIGSSTSHLVFSRLRLHREAQRLSSRFAVVEREVLWHSPVSFTPYAADQRIDSGALAAFIDGCYQAAGLTPDDIDSGAVILTGEALKRRNARAIADLFAAHGGKFVCASAGHHLEAVMAAHGSGAVAFSRRASGPVLHLDVGGGTTKAAVIRDGEIVQTAAIAAGGRLVVTSGAVASRVDGPARVAARHLGLSLAHGEPVPAAVTGELAAALAGAVTELARGEVSSPLARDLLLTDPLRPVPRPAAVTVSGGVAEYLYGHEHREFADIGPALARALRQRLARDLPGVPLRECGPRIRATVIGASQFSVQVSGNTIDVAGKPVLPRMNLPVLYPRIDLSGPFTGAQVSDGIVDAAVRMDLASGPGEVALGFGWHGDPSYPRLRALAEGVLSGRSRIGRARHPLVLLLSGDVARSLGRLLREELGLGGPSVVLDGLELAEFDHVDIGQVIAPSGVVPVTIKSLLFGTGDPEPPPCRENGHPAGQGFQNCRAAPSADHA